MSIIINRMQTEQLIMVFDINRVHVYHYVVVVGILSITEFLLDY